MEHSSLNNSLSAAIQLYRQMKNLSAEECARELGVSKTALLNIERNNANPTLETVEIIARNMGTDPLSLLGYRDASNFLTGFLLMEVVKHQNFKLDTLPRAVHHIQMAMDLLTVFMKDAGFDTEPE